MAEKKLQITIKQKANKSFTFQMKWRNGRVVNHDYNRRFDCARAVEELIAAIKNDDVVIKNEGIEAEVIKSDEK